ncbi:MAG: DUF4840 domain-containing protein [Muribaculaceae bacterium]
MKIKEMKLAKPFAAVMMLFLSLSFASCDDNEPNDGKLTSKVMYGEYTGLMTSQATALDETESTGVEITASVDNDIVCFNSFPIRDIVFSILGDEQATDAIIEAVGDVKYEIGYSPTIIESSKSINMLLDPKPLVLNVTLSPETDPLIVTVEVSATNEASFTSLDSKMKFAITIDKVWLGEGDNQTELAGFEPLTLNFDMTQEKK